VAVNPGEFPQEQRTSSGDLSSGKPTTARFRGTSDAEALHAEASLGFVNRYGEALQRPACNSTPSSQREIGTRSSFAHWRGSNRKYTGERMHVTALDWNVVLLIAQYSLLNQYPWRRFSNPWVRERRPITPDWCLPTPRSQLHQQLAFLVRSGCVGSPSISAQGNSALDGNDREQT
jgi:hypothetical protein